MADYSCEWCNKTEQCKFSFESVECIPQQKLDLVVKVSPELLKIIEVMVEEYKLADEDLFGDIIRAYQNSIIYNYPDEEELKYCRELLG